MRPSHLSTGPKRQQQPTLQDTCVSSFGGSSRLKLVRFYPPVPAPVHHLPTLLLHSYTHTPSRSRTMSLSGIFSALSMKKGKSRRKKGQDTSSGEDASPSHSPAPSEREGKQQKRKGGAKSSLFGSSSSAKQQQQPQQQKQQESAGSSTGGRVEVPPDRAERTPWGKVTAKKDAGAKKGKKGTGYDRMRFYLDRSSALRSLRAFIGSPGRVTLVCVERTRLVHELLDCGRLTLAI